MCVCACRVCGCVGAWVRGSSPNLQVDDEAVGVRDLDLAAISIAIPISTLNLHGPRHRPREQPAVLGGVAGLGEYDRPAWHVVAQAEEKVDDGLGPR